MKIKFKIQLPVLSQNSELVGVISIRQITNFLTSFKLSYNQPITKAIIKEFRNVNIHDPLKYLSKAFNRHHHVLVTSNDNETQRYYVTVHKDLLEYFMKNKE